MTFPQEPDKPTKVIEDGVNNKDVRLVWTYEAQTGETIIGLEFFREDLDGRNRVAIASRVQTAGFDPKNGLDRYYRAEMPSQLVLLNVDNVKEYKFILEVVFSRGSSLDRATSSVVVEVYGK